MNFQCIFNIIHTILYHFAPVQNDVRPLWKLFSQLKSQFIHAISLGTIFLCRIALILSFLALARIFHDIRLFLFTIMSILSSPTNLKWSSIVLSMFVDRLPKARFCKPKTEMFMDDFIEMFSNGTHFIPICDSIFANSTVCSCWLGSLRLCHMKLGFIDVFYI